MKTIYKYSLDPYQSGLPEIVMPKDAKILTLQLKQGAPFIWALVDTNKDHQKRYFIWRGTGNEIDSEVGTYIGTIQMERGNSVVLHLFELSREEEENLKKIKATL